MDEDIQTKIKEARKLLRAVYSDKIKQYRNTEKYKEAKRRFYEKNKDYYKEWYKRNRDRILAQHKNEYIDCDLCQKRINKVHLNQHLKTKKHINSMEYIDDLNLLII